MRSCGGPLASRAHRSSERTHVVEEGTARPRIRAAERRRRDRQAVRPARQAGRPLLLSQGRHARLHDTGLRNPRRLRRVRGAGAVVLGVSPDDEASHVKFKEKFDLPFTLLADPGHHVAEDYGVWGEKKYMGRTYMGVERSTFVIAADGTVKRVLRNVKPDTHADDVLAVLASYSRAATSSSSSASTANSSPSFARGASSRARRSARAPRRCRRRRRARP